MALQEWPEKLYVRSEEEEEVSGRYHRIEGREHNGHPIWKHDTDEFFIFCGRASMEPDLPFILDWVLTKNEADIKSNVGVLFCLRDKISDVLPQPFLLIFSPQATMFQGGTGHTYQRIFLHASHLCEKKKVPPAAQ